MEIENYESDIMHIYEWVDSVNLSRPKKNISRDFSDGGGFYIILVLLAELIKYYIPKAVELHNYPSANSATLKISNWNTLNKKVFKKMGFQLSKNEIEDIVNYKQMAVENLLKIIYEKINNYKGDLKQDSFYQENENKPSDVFEDTSKKNFYVNQVRERDDIIEELKSVLEMTEVKLKKSEDTKSTLERQIRDYTEKLKALGLV